MIQVLGEVVDFNLHLKKGEGWLVLSSHTRECGVLNSLRWVGSGLFLRNGFVVKYVFQIGCGSYRKPLEAPQQWGRVRELWEVENKSCIYNQDQLQWL